ncbi:MAG: hotdog fold thioesterase [Saprospirales bacterium]|nr:MAG: hotdog fold thioesterase [Saprospirales bacterium]
MTVSDLNEFCKNTMIEHLGIEFTRIEEGFIEGKMPVGSRTVQPMRLLHGGASIALAETLGSAGSMSLIDPAGYYVVGMQVSANHLASVSSGIVTGKARLLHKGKSTHVWDVVVQCENDRILLACRLTNMIVPKRDS